MTAENSFFMESAGARARAGINQLHYGGGLIHSNVCSLLREPEIVCHILCQLLGISMHFHQGILSLLGYAKLSSPNG